MSLGLLFLKRTDRQGWFRNLVTIFAITLSTVILLSAMAIAHALAQQEVRSSWPNNLVYTNRKKLNSDTKTTGMTAITLSSGEFADESFLQIGLRQLDSDAPLLPGLIREPAENEVFVSKGLIELIKQNPLLAERFSGYEVKAIFPENLLSSPMQKRLIYRLSDKTLADNSGADSRIRLFNREDLTQIQKLPSTRTQMIINVFMVLCGLGVCFPLLILIISATRVGMMQRERRYAALSLLGTSKQQINRIILSETLLAAGLAAALGSSLYFLVRSTLLVNLQLYQDKFFANDLVVEPLIFAGVIGLVLIVAVLVNSLALRKVKTSPLGVVKSQKKLRRPTVLSLIPLFVTIIGVWQMNRLGAEWFLQEGNMLYFVAVFLLAMIGLLTAGSFLTYLCAKLFDYCSRRASLIMASKRLKMFARPIFSSVSGVVLALFVGSFFVSIIASVKLSLAQYYRMEANMVEVGRLRMQADKIVFNTNDNSRLKLLIEAIKQDSKLAPSLKQIYVGQYYREKSPIELGQTSTNEQDDDDNKLIFGRVYKCGDLHSLTQLKCPDGLKADSEVIVEENYETKQVKVSPFTPELRARGELKNSETTLAFNDVVSARLGKLYLQNLAGRLFYKTGLEIYITTTDNFFDPLKGFYGLIQAVMIGIVGTIVVAGFSLAVSTIGSFFERKKSFYNLRLMGVDLKMLNRLVLIESFIPMILASILAVTAGILMARYIGSIMSYNFKFALPELDFFATVGLSLVATFVIILAILPILKRITSLSQNRTE